MSIETKKKISAGISGAYWMSFIECAWYLPDIRVYEGLDWRIEIGLYVLTLLPAIFFTWLACD